MQLREQAGDGEIVAVIVGDEEAEEGLFEILAEANIAALSGCDFKRIVTTDPHSLNTVRNEYPDLGGRWSVVHRTTLLLELIDSGPLQPERQLSYTVTYHDPCRLGRMNGEHPSPLPPRAATVHAPGDAAQPREQALLRRGGGLIWMPTRLTSLRGPDQRGGVVAGGGAGRGYLPQGRDDGRGRDQDLGQQGGD